MISCCSVLGAKKALFLMSHLYSFFFSLRTPTDCGMQVHEKEEHKKNGNIPGIFSALHPQDTLPFPCSLHILHNLLLILPSFWSFCFLSFPSLEKLFLKNIFSWMPDDFSQISHLITYSISLLCLQDSTSRVCSVATWGEG